MFFRQRFDIAQLYSPLTFTLPALAVLASPCRSIGTFHTYFEGSRIYAGLRHQLQKHLVDKLDGQTFPAGHVTDVAPVVALGRIMMWAGRLHVDARSRVNVQGGNS